MVALPSAVIEAVKRCSPHKMNGEPKGRLVHGSEVLTWVEGFFSDYGQGGIFLRQVFERRQVLKYPRQADCWILEWWEPPEFWGTPEQWAATTRQWEGGRAFNLCGPYPAEGDYRLLVTFRHQVTGKPVEPTATLIEYVFSKLHKPTLGELLVEQAAKEVRQKKERGERVAAVVGDIPFERTTQQSLPKGIVEEDQRRQDF